MCIYMSNMMKKSAISEEHWCDEWCSQVAEDAGRFHGLPTVCRVQL